MAKPHAVALTADVPREIVAGQRFRAMLIVENTSSDLVTISNVEPAVVSNMTSGVEFLATDDNGLTELEAKTQRILREMQYQVRVAELELRADHSLLAALQMTARAISTFVVPSLSHTTMSNDISREALRIDEWNDVIRLEKQIINSLPESAQTAALRRAFAINRDKLEECNKKLASIDKNLTNDFTLQSGDKKPYAFHFRAPHSLRRRQETVRFAVSYSVAIKDKPVQRTTDATMTLSVLPSTLAAPAGGLLGGILGYAVRGGLSQNLTSDWETVIRALACGLLGLIFALATARKPESTKVLTVEDFWGGLFVGATSGLFSTEVLDKLKLLVK